MIKKTTPSWTFTTKSNLCTHTEHITLQKVARKLISISLIAIFLYRSNVYAGFSKVANIDPRGLFIISSSSSTMKVIFIKLLSYNKCLGGGSMKH